MESVDWLTSRGVSSVEFQLADTLQRYNQMWRYNLDEDRANRRSRSLGDKWLVTNSSTIRYAMSVFDHVTVSRWDYWLNQPEVSNIVRNLTRLTTNDVRLKSALSADIERYLQSRKTRVDSNRVTLSRAFLIEEMAVSAVSVLIEPANEIYPGERQKAELYLVQDYQGSARWIEALRRLTFIDLRPHEQGPNAPCIHEG